MTRFRYPTGWPEYLKDPARSLTERPPLPYWLAPGRNMLGQGASVKRSYVYWSQIHWATPPWLSAADWAKVRALYESSNPAHEQVDHIVPLKHALVCGLNVPWNMEKLAIKENQEKSNHWWPDCPDHLCPIINGNRELFEVVITPRQMRLL